MKQVIIRLLLLVMVTSVAPLPAQSIQEKRAQLVDGSVRRTQVDDGAIGRLNSSYHELREQLRALRAEANRLFEEKAPEQSFVDVRDAVREVRSQMREVLEEARRLGSENIDAESYALWSQPGGTLEQLVEDYGSLEYVYIFPPTARDRGLGILSDLPVPKEMWDEMLVQVLEQSGFGVQQLNAYLRLVFPLEDALAHLTAVTANRSDLDLYDSADRVGLLLSPDPTEMRRVAQILERFTQGGPTKVNRIGGALFLSGSVGALKEALKVYDFVAAQHVGFEYRLVSLRRGSAEEMSQMLTAVFSLSEEAQDGIADSLQVIPLQESSRALFLIGHSSEVQRAEKILEDLQSQLGDAQEKLIHWYHCQHSEPEDLAQILDKVYALIRSERIAGEADEEIEQIAEEAQTEPDELYDDGFSIVVDPKRLDPSEESPKDSLSKRKNFIVDGKTGSIIMVVEPSALERLQPLIARLDVPKEMVHIEVIFLEKRMIDTNNHGLNLLKLGDGVLTTGANPVPITNRTETLSFDGGTTGILSYILRLPKTGSFPSLDLAYNFLLRQEDIQVNSTPSITTINQTKAVVKFVEERSVSTGLKVIDTANAAAPTAENGFSRAQFGITVEITPTIHRADEIEEGFGDYITLDSKIFVDLVESNENDRPVVNRKNITNQVSIPDGQTVVIGGLRSKDSRDVKDSVPFLGEIPGFGKLFSKTTMSDTSVETFIMITPRIITNSKEDLKRMRQEAMTRRPGDVPEFIQKLVKARDGERNRLFRQGLTMLFGRQIPKSAAISEYDGR